MQFETHNNDDLLAHLVCRAQLAERLKLIGDSDNTDVVFLNHKIARVSLLGLPVTTKNEGELSSFQVKRSFEKTLVGSRARPLADVFSWTMRLARV